MPLYTGRRVPRRPDLWVRSLQRHMVKLVIALVLAGIFAWHRTGTRTPFGTDHERYDGKTFSCMHVVDGDTIDIDAPDGMKASTRIRLWGVDTPETVKPGTPPMYFGHEASEYTKSRVNHKPVRVVLAPNTTRDKYDRLLAYVYPAGSDGMLNEDIISGGYGYVDSRFSHPWKERFIQLENRARKAKLGLWAKVTLDQMPEWRQRFEEHRANGRTSKR
jgi:endonuclease YncB( thermonuclease family)